MDKDKKIAQLDEQQKQLEKEIRSFNRKIGLVIFILLVFFSWILYREFITIYPKPLETNDQKINHLSATDN
ncbi:hypothetical protein [Zunongwangia pacifica]|uniref:Uncharacterized protein n=1 Tax=Zunongwangia pacifica TaxID=2911062 RepID=A0A9X1ZXZ2_9FLAO|nr:hypothetical protein [Zunongwangia pacifica]MCL6218471.1 hypothetical protein [Zunongwangia pacifica]